MSKRADLFGDEVTVLQGLPLEAQQATLVPAAAAEESADDERRHFIGGSDAAAICGLSPWKTPYQLYQEKRGEIPPADLSSNERVYWGTVLEEVVAREYSKRTGRTVRRVNRTLYHPDLPFIAAHIDRQVVGDDRILECKTTDAAHSADWGEEGSEEIPRHYQPQPQHYLAVTDKALCDVAVLIGGNRLRIYTIKRDEEFIRMLIEAEREFWERVQLGTPPDPASPAEASIRWRLSAAGEMEGTVEDHLTAQGIIGLRAQIMDLANQEAGLELTLMKRMGDAADTLTFRGQRLCTWKTQTRTFVNLKVLEKAYPDLVAQFRESKQSRFFRPCLKS